MKAAEEAKKAMKSNKPTSYILHCTNNWQKSFSFSPNTLVSKVIKKMLSCVWKNAEPTDFCLVKANNINRKSWPVVKIRASNV